MSTTNILSDLFILDLANNHQGDIEHAKRIIDSCGEIARRNEVRCAMKFQFRDIPNFIHSAWRQRTDVPHIPRFMSTSMSRNDFETLTQRAKAAGLITMATPFDERSVDLLVEFGIEIVKIASCSMNDRPLLRKIAHTGKPVVASTAGAIIGDIDRVVSLYGDGSRPLALMHCVAIYPTPAADLCLNQIDVLRARYRDILIGFSTHEDPENMLPVAIAYSKGARLFERHVGINTDKYKLNGYSSTPDQLERWIRAYKETAASCGGTNRKPASPKEAESLRSLMRGVFAKRAIKKGEVLGTDDIYFAMPLEPGKLASKDWVDGMVAQADVVVDDAMPGTMAEAIPPDDELIFGIMLHVTGLLSEARIHIGKGSSVEISHHYGLRQFREFGAVIIDCINRQYCKKLLVMLPLQKHPYHHHVKKEETFQLLHGDLEVELEGHTHQLRPGDTLVVPAGAWHRFHSVHGAVVEEVSTTHFDNDSVYQHEVIKNMSRAERKTKIENWEATQRVRR